MGTRSLTHIMDDGKPLVTIYRQFDGYPSGHGQDLADFLEGLTVVNGIGSRERKIANGMGCLAAQLVGHLKAESAKSAYQPNGPQPGDIAGNVYIYPAGIEGCGEEYVYTVSMPGEAPTDFGNPTGPVELTVHDCHTGEVMPLADALAAEAFA